MRNHEKATTVIESMTRLCREMGILVVAEGIETVAEHDELIELGCDFLQGYLFARPAAAFPEISGGAGRV